MGRIPQRKSIGAPGVIFKKKVDTGVKMSKPVPTRRSPASSSNCLIITRPRRNGKASATNGKSQDKSGEATGRRQLKRKANVTENTETKKRVRLNETVKETENATSDYQKMIELASSLASNPEPFDCSICFAFVAAGVGVILHECLHNFCRPCLVATIEHSETVAIECPFVDDIYSCESHLQELEIKALVDAALYDRYLQRSLNLAENSSQDSFHCKTVDCPGWCFHEKRVKSFHCNVCGNSNCLSCKAIHQDMTCKQYKEQKRKNKQELKTKKHLDDMIRKGQVMLCPTCKAIVKKQGGCDGLNCVMCRTALCWATKGPRWGPRGYGDISGGCKCNVGGKRCHPRCMNCH